MDFNEKIGLGTVQFGTEYGISNKNGQTSPDEVKRILSYATDHGVKCLDTASAYGNSEKVLGQYSLKPFDIVSKFLPEKAKGRLEDQFTKTIRDLGVEYIYGYLAHRPMSLVDNKNEWKNLLNLKEMGKVKKVGFSLNSPHELEALIEQGMYPDLVQVPFNYFDKRFQSILLRLKEKDCEVHSRSAFLQGLFFCDTSALSSHFNEVKDLINEMQNMGKELSGGLLSFCVSKRFIDKVIIGVNNLNQLKANLTSLKVNIQLPIITKQIPDNIVMPTKWPKE